MRFIAEAGLVRGYNKGEGLRWALSDRQQVFGYVVRMHGRRLMRSAEQGSRRNSPLLPYALPTACPAGVANPSVGVYG